MQLTLLSSKELKTFSNLKHGGNSSLRKRKMKRPLLPNKLTHVVFKSSKAKNDLSFYKFKLQVQNLLHERAKKYQIEILDFVNMGNHLHLKVKSKNLVNFRNFLRTFPALLARLITKVKKGFKFGKFWDCLVYTRVLLSKFEALGLKGYFNANRIERSQGYIAREQYIRNLNLRLSQIKKSAKDYLLKS